MGAFTGSPGPTGTTPRRLLGVAAATVVACAVLLLVLLVVQRVTAPPQWLAQLRADTAFDDRVRAAAEVRGEELGDVLRGPAWQDGDLDLLAEGLALWRGAVPEPWSSRVEGIVVEDERELPRGAAVRVHDTIVLYLNVDVLEQVRERPSLADPLLHHELGHLLMFLEADPTAPLPDPDSPGCVLVTALDCVPPDGLGATFAAAFWDDVDLASLPQPLDPAATPGRSARHRASPAAYASLYAASDPLEDFAETFAVLVRDPYPTTGTATPAPGSLAAKVAWLRERPAVYVLAERIAGAG